MPIVSEEMILDRVNRADVAFGHIRRDDVFPEHANFRVAHVLIFNSRKELLLQRLALSRKRNPGAWGSSVAAYLFASESYEHAARRRVSQELGVATPQLSFVGKTSMMDSGSLKFIGVFTAHSDGPFNVDHSHIDEIEFEPTARVQRMIDEGPQQFTPTFLHVFRFVQSKTR